MNYSLLKKLRRDVNKQRNTNNMLLPLLFVINRSLTTWLKQSVSPMLNPHNDRLY